MRNNTFGDIIIQILFPCYLKLTIYFEGYQKLGVFLHKQIKNEFSLFAAGNKNEASLYAFIQLNLRFLEQKTLWKMTNLINEVNTKESKTINSILSKVKLDLKN